MKAWCWPGGLIEFGRKLPDGALLIAEGPAATLRDFIEPVARHGYRTRKIKGRPTKVPGSDHLLVPGLPETPGHDQKLEKLWQWLAWIAKRAPRGIVVHGHTAS